MKNSIKLTFCSIITALSVIFMLLSYFPYFTYAVPAVTGLLIMVLVIELGCRFAFAAYVAASLLIFLFAEPESKLMYICLFGYYPILKAIIERLRKPVFEWVLKLLIFNAAVISVYFIFAGLFGISLEDFKAFGKYGALIFLLLGNVVFVFYDIAVSRMAMFYMGTLHKRVKKMLKL